MVTAQQVSGDWPMFRADPSHSGVGTGIPVLNATLLWNYSTGSQIYSSPAISKPAKRIIALSIICPFPSMPPTYQKHE